MKVITFGCRLNMFESVVIQKQVAGLDDVIVINTCAVTGEAERQCRQAIRKAARENPNAKIVVTGCGAQIHPEEYARMPEVSKVLGNREKLTPDSFFNPEKVLVEPVCESVVKLPVLSEFDGRLRAFLQIQQGCDHTCTFCIVPKARGRCSGLKPDDVIAQARAFVNQGICELILTGVDITAYPYGFTALVERLIHEVDGLRRLRFGSLDPACLDDRFVRLVETYDVIMPHFHLSVQSGDDLILKRMGRRHLRRQVIDFAAAVRRVRPCVVLGADFITGFPTETEEQFENTLLLVKEAGLTHLHVFPYSRRTGTPADKMPMVPVSERKNRARILRETGLWLYDKLLDRMLGQTVPVLIERPGQGLSDTYLRVFVNSSVMPGQIVPVSIVKRRGHELVGQVEERS